MNFTCRPEFKLGELIEEFNKDKMRHVPIRNIRTNRLAEEAGLIHSRYICMVMGD